MSGEDTELAKDLGPLAALTIGIGTMIGAGIFVLPGTAVARAGPLAVLAFVIGGGIALLTALSASELGTAMPKSGGAYYYVNHALGPLFGSITGWSNWLGLAFASAFYMVGFGQYITAVGSYIGELTGFQPDLSFLAALPLPLWQIIALLGAGLFITVNYVGAKETGRLQNIIVVTLVLILAVFTLFGILEADVQRLQPFVPPETGYGPLFPVTALVFVSFLGFVQITSVAEEIQDPGRNLPRAVIGSVVIVTTIYALVLLVILAAVDNSLIADNDTAVVDVAQVLIGPVGAAALLVGGLLATASSANASILASSRINFAMGRDRIISPALNEIHPRFATPYRAIAVTGALILLFILLGTVETLATAGSVLHLIIYGLLNVALIVMREADPPEYDPDYTVPLYPFTPILGAVLSFAIIVFITPIIIVLSAGLVVGAVAWYFGYARSRATKQGILGQYVLSRADRMPDTAVSAASGVQPDGGDYRVMVPLANPEHEHALVELASAIAKQHNGTVVATHIVQVPAQTALAEAAEHVDELDETTADLLGSAREDAESFDVPIETHTIVSHRRLEEVFTAAETHDADMVIMGWGDDPHGSPGRVETALDEVTGTIPCDFLVLKDRGFDPGQIVVPTAGGPDSDLSAAVATVLQEAYGSEVTLLHVADDEDEGEAREFLEEWARDHGFEDATFRIETGDVETAIEAAAEDATLIAVGATEQGLLSRLVSRSLVLDVVYDLDCSVLLAEKYRKRSLWERLFG